MADYAAFQLLKKVYIHYFIVNLHLNQILLIQCLLFLSMI